MLDRHARLCLDKTWPRLLGLVAAMTAIVAAGIGSKGARLALLRLLRPAESLARRLLVLMALEAGPPDMTATRAPGQIRSGPASGVGPRFPLAESMPAFGLVFANEKATAATAGTPPAPPITAPAPINPARALARFAALKDVAADPDRHARRMALWLARNAKGRGRVTPLRPGPPPGALKRPADRRLDTLLRDVHYFAREAIRPRPG